MKKILLSLSMIAVVALIAVGATGAFFSDTETSTGNTFAAGAIDLTVDSEQHYNNAVCVATGNNGTSSAAYSWQLDPNGGGLQDPQYPEIGSACDGTWAAADLGTQKFFNFSDIKPGDSGENTVSLHVANNDAWLRLIIKDVTDLDNSCNEPEGSDEMLNLDGSVSTIPSCSTTGELRENLLFSVWLDQGYESGFQGKEKDEGEGDNIWQGESYEPMIITEGPIDTDGETWDLKDLDDAYLASGDTAYFGIAWNLPDVVGNIVQTDSLGATMEFQVEQRRNNPTPFEID